MQPYIFRLVFLLLALLLAASHASNAQAQASCKKKTAGYFKLVMAGVRLGDARIAGLPERLSEGLGDPQRGREIVRDSGKGNCLACHRIPAFAGETGQATIGPSLEGVGSRYTEPQLRQIIVDSRKIFPSTIMPAFYKNEKLDRVAPGQEGKTILTGQEIEDVIAFLKTLK